MLGNSRGTSILLIIMLMGLAAIIVQSSLIQDSLTLRSSWKDSTVYTSKTQLLFSLTDDLINGIPLQFSRYSTNTALEECLKGTATIPCNENTTYEMVLYAPIYQQSYQGGSWPTPPSNVPLLAGGLSTNLSLFMANGARCPYAKTAADDFCPLQAIAEFKPLCGGDADNPSLLPPGGGGPCYDTATGKQIPAKGFDITVGVARFMNGRLINRLPSYRNQLEPGSDAKKFRFPASVFRK